MSEEIDRLKPNSKIRIRRIVIFSIINVFLLAATVGFILATIYGGSGEWDFEVGLSVGVWSLFAMIVAGVVDLIYLIIVLVINSKRKGRIN